MNDARRFQGARVHADMTSAPVYEFRGRVPAAAAVIAAPLYRETIAAVNGRRALITASPDYGPDAAWPTRLHTYGCASSWRRQSEPELGREQWSHIRSKHQPCVGWISPIVSVSIYVRGDSDAISMPAGFRRRPVGKTLIINVFTVISLTYVSLAS